MKAGELEAGVSGGEGGRLSLATLREEVVDEGGGTHRKFQRLREAYVAIGGRSRWEETDSKGTEIGGGSTYASCQYIFIFWTPVTPWTKSSKTRSRTHLTRHRPSPDISMRKEAQHNIRPPPFLLSLQSTIRLQNRQPINLLSKRAGI